MPTKVPVQVWSLTAKDRCDRCGSQAYVRIIIGESDLLLCAHHYAQHADQLIHYPARDEREHLRRDAG